MIEQLVESYQKLNVLSFHWERPVTWSSGIMSPIYCDHRKLLAFPEIWADWIRALEERLFYHYPGVEMVAAVATAGIPHGAVLSMRNELPFSYVRSKGKDHGSLRFVEGADVVGKKVVVVEDLLSTGQSALGAVEMVKESGGEVLGVLSLFSYELPTMVERFRSLGVKKVSVITLTELTNKLIQRGEITQRELTSLLEWQQRH